MRLNKWQLDLLSTLLGLVSGFSFILYANDFLPYKIAFTFGGLGIMLLGYFSQRPTDGHPNTTEAEDDYYRR